MLIIFLILIQVVSTYGAPSNGTSKINLYPPEFKDRLKDQNLETNRTYKYTLPPRSDRDQGDRIRCIVTLGIK